MLFPLATRLAAFTLLLQYHASILSIARVSTPTHTTLHIFTDEHENRYVPPASSNAESHDCNDASVAPGTPCNVQCPAGRTRVGTEVVCVGGSGSAPGSYSGQISCSENAVCPSGCSGGSCPGLSTLINVPVTQVRFCPAHTHFTFCTCIYPLALWY